MTQTTREEPTTSWLSAAVALPGITALGAALLYAAGLVARAGELAAGGFSPQDVLPLVPLQQGLARGVALLLDPTTAFGFLTVASLWLISLLPERQKTVQRRQQRIAQSQEQCMLIEGAASDLENTVPHPALSDVRQRLTRVHGLLARPSSDYLYEAEREVLRAAHDLRAQAHAHQVTTETTRALDALIGETEQPSEPRWTRWLIPLLMTAAWALGVLTSDLSSAPAYTVFWGTIVVVYWGSFLDRPLGTRTFQSLLTVWLLAFVLGQAYLGARPLQQVEIRLDDGHLLQGQLLASPATQAGIWYVAPRKDEIVAVATTDTQAVRIRDANQPGRYKSRSLIDLISGK